MSIAFLISTLYGVAVLITCLRIILDSNTPSKSLAYLLLVLVFPLFGIIFYFAVGSNYRKHKLYNKKIAIDKQSYPELEEQISTYSTNALRRQEKDLKHFYPLASLFKHKQYAFHNNQVRLLINGESKFPEVIQSLAAAKKHIHLEYYIYENDEIGQAIAELLMEKANQGVKVRMIYDDFGSRGIKRNLVKRLIDAGVEVYPFYKIHFPLFANRLNYRNHRKIVVIDGDVGFIGGINVSDNYINRSSDRLFWRDTHLKISGAAVLSLQYTFLTDWNFCSGQGLSFSEEFFPRPTSEGFGEGHYVQVISSGPDSDYPNILYSLIQMIALAKTEVNITNPYFIPDRTFLDALKVAALRGVRIRLLVPGVSDSWFVNSTSQSYFREMLEVGVEIFRYQKGFVHAKTLVCDKQVSVVGTANLDNRSFELNFETNAIIYSPSVAAEVQSAFDRDLDHSQQILLEDWKERPGYLTLIEKFLQLFAPLM